MRILSKYLVSFFNIYVSTYLTQLVSLFLANTMETRMFCDDRWIGFWILFGHKMLVEVMTFLLKEEWIIMFNR